MTGHRTNSGAQLQREWQIPARQVRYHKDDDLSSRPDFAIALYPGHLCTRSGDLIEQSFQVTGQTPPTFLLQAWDDPVDNICNSTTYASALSAAGVPAEVHLFAKGGHAFGLRPNPHPISSWPLLVENWLREIKVL